MTSTAKRYGSDYERLVARYLGLERFPAGFHADKGDLWGDPLFTVECKARRSGGRLDFAAWLRQARAEGQRALKPFSIVVVKRPQLGIEQSYVVLDLETFRRIRERIQDGS